MNRSLAKFLIGADEKDLIEIFKEAVIISGGVEVLEKISYTIQVAEEDCKETIDGNNL